MQKISLDEVKGVKLGSKNCSDAIEKSVK